jgi:predicted methyltransferase
MRRFMSVWILIGLMACALAPISSAESPVIEVPTPSDLLVSALDAQSTEQKSRYPARHPKETLEFFGVVPGMTVVEVLPGGGWYSKLLLAYLGSQGQLIGADYAVDMVEKLGFYDAERLAAKKRWVETWTRDAEGWRGTNGASVSAFVLGSMPDSVAGSADAVLFIRALHNLNRVEAQGGYLTTALGDAHRALKPGGILGVVQHEARAEMPDSWADGSNGYLKRAALVARIEAAGFEYLADSEVNANPADRPNQEEFVWRLPPSFATSRDDAAKHASFEAIGESNRMTLKFRKTE